MGRYWNPDVPFNELWALVNPLLLLFLNLCPMCNAMLHISHPISRAIPCPKSCSIMSHCNHIPYQILCITHAPPTSLIRLIMSHHLLPCYAVAISIIMRKHTVPSIAVKVKLAMLLLHSGRCIGQRKRIMVSCYTLINKYIKKIKI